MTTFFFVIDENHNIIPLRLYNSRGSKTGKVCFELNSQPVGLERVGKTIVVGCMDDTLQCYTTKVIQVNI